MAISFGSPEYIALEHLIKIKQKNLKEFEGKARELAHFTAQQYKANIHIIFRIAKELQEQYFDVEDIENLIVSLEDPHYIFKFAREIKNADIHKLQKAIIASGKLNYIAKFACFIDGADTDLIENLIVDANNPKAAYIYLKYGKHPNIQKLKHIFFKSKKPRYLYLLAQLTNDPADISLIQSIILSSHSHMYVRLFAAHIPGADIKKLEDRILATKNFEEIQKFAKLVKSEKANKLVMLM